MVCVRRGLKGFAEFAGVAEQVDSTARAFLADDYAVEMFVLERAEEPLDFAEWSVGSSPVCGRDRTAVVAGEREVWDPFGLDNGPAEPTERSPNGTQLAAAVRGCCSAGQGVTQGRHAARDEIHVRARLR